MLKACVDLIPKEKNEKRDKLSYINHSSPTHPNRVTFHREDLCTENFTPIYYYPKQKRAYKPARAG